MAMRPASILPIVSISLSARAATARRNGRGGLSQSTF